jgi:hypothetical protein
MASAFWGGVADTLLQERQANDAAKRETDAYKKKQQILLDMQRNEKPDYQAKVWRILDGNGNEVATRPMTPSEIQDRDLTVRKTEADTKQSETKAKGAELEYGLDVQYGDSDRRLGQDSTKANIAASRQSAAASAHSMKLASAREGREQATYEENKGSEVGNFAATQLSLLASELSQRFEDPRAPQPTTTYSEAANDIERIAADNTLTAAQKKQNILKYIGAVKAGLPQRAPKEAAGNSLDSFAPVAPIKHK